MDRNRLWQFNGHWRGLVEQLRSRPGYSRSHWNIPMRRGHCKFYSKDRSAVENHCCSSYYLACAVNGVGSQHTTFTSCQNAACSNEFFLCWVDYTSERKRFVWANVIFVAYFILRGHDRHFLRLLLFLTGMICPLMQKHFLWLLLKCNALYCR